jgi:hypothetical protein
MANFKIVMRKGPTPGQTFDLTGTDISIGREKNAGIVINIPEVSRRHARFRLDAGIYMLEDLGSTNGTFVNGLRLTSPYRVRDGDIELEFLGEEKDPYATVIASSKQAATVVVDEPLELPSYEPSPMYEEPPPVAPPPLPETPPYAEPYPTDEMDYGLEYKEEKPKNRIWLWAGVGCLVIIVIGCLAAAFLFDTMDMYCQPPFDSIFSFLYDC